LLEMSPEAPLVFDSILERLRRVPGVQSAAGTSRAPVTAIAREVTFAIEGRASDELSESSYRLITPGYFETMRIAVLRGRSMRATDIGDSPWVAVVNQAFARRYFPGEDPIGKRVTVTIVTDERPREIVGIVGDTPLARQEQEPAPIVYLSHQQQPEHSRAGFGDERMGMTFVMRLAEPSERVVPAVRRAVSEVAPAAPIAQMEMLESYVARQIEAPVHYMWLLSAIGALAVLIAGFGLHGVVAYSLTHRSREMAIRLALGARPAALLGLTVREGAMMVGAGFLLGAAGAAISTRVLTAVLWGVTPTDPATFAAVAVLLMAIAVLATLGPASRIFRLDVRSVLSEE
jgi:putative ABC transport system permease protein